MSPTPRRPLTLVIDGRHDDPRFPGVGRLVRGLLGALPTVTRPGEQVVVLRTSEQPPLADLRVHPVAAPPYGLAEQLGIPRALRELDAAAYLSAAMVMPLRPGVPTVVTLLDFIPQRLPHTVSPQARLIAPMAARLALRASAAAVAISASTRDDARELFPRARLPIHVVPLAVDPDLAPPQEAVIGAARRRLDLPHPFLLHVGINKPHKNAAALLAAWRRLPTPRPDLVFVGPIDPRYPDPSALPDAVEATRAAGEGPGRVRHLGRLDDADLAALYACAALFVFPSAYEGFGLPPLEAMACGAAVVVSDRASLPEVVGDAAVTVDPDDPPSFADVLAALLADPERRDALAAAGRTHAATFTWDRTTKGFLDVLRSVADR